jgi:hypothetical protein
MAEHAVAIELVQGEDFAGQFFWTDPYGIPVKITEPIQMDVRDSTGQVVMRFLPSNDPETEPYLMYVTTSGFIQITVPSIYTFELVPGRYVFDLFASCTESSTIFSKPLARIVGGFVDVRQSVTKLNDPDAWASQAQFEEGVNP